MKVFFKTFGCRTNIFDTQIMISSLKNFVICDNLEGADIVVINSCTVTNGADKVAREYISRARKLNKKIFFTGCALDSVGKSAFEKGEIFGAFGHSKKQEIESLFESKSRFFIKNDLAHLDNMIVDRFLGKSRAFVKIEEGCNFACSYCIIPQVRGRARSIPRAQILSQIKTLADSGVSEVVLSGTNLGSYGKDTNDTLPKLLIAISKINGIKRVRLGSLEPSQIKEDFLELLDSDFLARHLHIALQHTDDEMLRIMNRINRFKKDLTLFEKISEKGFAIGSDFIVAHPGESEEIFLRGLNNLKSIPLTHAHIFIYSPRNNTKSSNLANLTNKTEAKKRLNILKNVINEKNARFRENLARERISLDILVENKKDEFFFGFDQFYNRMKIKSTLNLARNWLSLKNYQIDGEYNYVEI